MTVPDWQIAGTMASAQRAAILAALTHAAYNLTHAAQRLRIGRTTLYRLMKTYDVPLAERRPAAPADAGAGAPADPPQHVILVDGRWYLVARDRDGPGDTPAARSGS